MKTSFEKYKIVIIPFFYILFYFWDSKIILFKFLFSNLSKEIYKLIYFRKGKTLLIGSLDDILIFYCLCWIFMLAIICSLFCFFKAEFLRKGIYITLFIHLFFFVMYLMY